MIDEAPSPSVWNDKAADVFPEYQLTFGHVVTDLTLDERSMRRLFQKLGLTKQTYSGEISHERLPRLDGGGATLSSDSEAHVLVAQAEGASCVFAPHRMFFSNASWIKWNKRNGGLICIAHQMEKDKWFYYIFLKGKKSMNACLESGDLRFPPDPAVTVKLQGKEIFDDTEKKGGKVATAEMKDLLARDMFLHWDSAAGRLEVSRAFKPVEVTIDTVHFIFEVR